MSRVRRGFGPWRSKVVSTAAALLTAIALSVSLSAPSAADDLDDQKAEVSAELAEVRAAIDAGEDTLGAAQTLLADAKANLAQIRAELDAKIIARDAAIAEHAAQLVRYESAVAEANTALARVAAGELEVANQKDAISLSVQLSVQQNQTMLSFSLFVTDFDVSQVNNRAQWADTMFTTANGELIKLELLQNQLERDRMSAQTAEARAQVAQETAAAKLAEAEALAAEAEAAAANVAYQVGVLEAAESLAAEELAVFKDRESEFESQIAEIEAEIRARNAAADSNGDVVSRPSDGSGMLAWPLNGGVITSYQGWRWHPVYGYWSYHSGTDIGINCGSPVYASESGRAGHVGWYGELGQYIRIDHDKIDGKWVVTGYAHLSGYAISQGQWVTRGQLIGYVGTTGLSTGCHLHWNLFLDGVAADALEYM
ncbi:MAG: peptidoglycan DD-metalloendopeptidase family protein [Propionibacteriaceae bacterium]|nr:peptidoglycan DD-metalloendopeptidase family protein [Propionibacteriaceae bacterium]